MALRYDISWDVATLEDPGLQLKCTADSTEFEITITSGQYTHSGIGSVDATWTTFADDLKTELDSGNPGSVTFTVVRNSGTGYTITPSAGTMTLNFATTTSAYGTNMRRILGFDASQSAAAQHKSNVRPYYVVIPASQGRTEYTRERERPDIVQEALADDGSRVFIAKATADKIGDWTQVAEIETTPASFKSPGTPTHKDMVDDGTTADDVPFSWEHFFEHARRAKHRITVVENLNAEVWELRADGMFFDPKRWTGTDLPIWSIPLKCRLIGRYYEGALPPPPGE